MIYAGFSGPASPSSSRLCHVKRRMTGLPMSSHPHLSNSGILCRPFVEFAIVHHQHSIITSHNYLFNTLRAHNGRSSRFRYVACTSWPSFLR